jgi:hypothetical protein
MKAWSRHPAMSNPSRPARRKGPTFLILAALSLFGAASICRLNLPAGEPGIAWVSEKERADSPRLAELVDAGGNALLSAVGTWKVYDLYALKMARWEPASWTREADADAEAIYAIAWPFASGWKDYRRKSG